MLFPNFEKNVCKTFVYSRKPNKNHQDHASRVNSMPDIYSNECNMQVRQWNILNKRTMNIFQYMLAWSLKTSYKILNLTKQKQRRLNKRGKLKAYDITRIRFFFVKARVKPQEFFMLSNNADLVFWKLG